MAIPPVRCSRKATSTGKQCKRYARPGTSVCSKHGARRDDIADKAQQTVTLATLLASDPRPVFEVLQDAIHTLDSVHRKTKVDALKQDQEKGSIDADTVTELVNSSRGAAAVSLAATRTAAWQAIAQSHERRVHLEARLLARLVEYTVTPLIHALENAGLQAKDAESLRRWIGHHLREAIGQTSERGDVPSLGEAPLPDALSHLAILPRAELEALRERARRHTLQISDRPADVFVPSDFETSSRDMPPRAPSTVRADLPRDSHIGLLGTRHTRHYTERNQP